jgi:hypothetical protein
LTSLDVVTQGVRVLSNDLLELEGSATLLIITSLRLYIK